MSKSETKPPAILEDGMESSLHISSRFFLYCWVVKVVVFSSRMRGHMTFSQTNRRFWVADAYLPLSSIDNVQKVRFSLY